LNAAHATAYARFFSLGPQTEQSQQHRHEELNRQIHDHGLSYNLYSSNGRPQRPWSLELFPLLVRKHEWETIAKGISQRAGLLERIAGDVYGAGQLLRKALLPGALVYGHPGYIPALKRGPSDPPREYLQVVAFDLARLPDQRWAVLSHRTQAPSGLGYALANRTLISRQHADAFQALQVEPWTPLLQRFIESLGRLNPEGGPSHIALLTPGPYNETYFEQVYLARQFGLTLVEGHDLVVRNNQVFLKALKGLERVHVLIKRMDDAFLDPLNLRADSTLGAPGLLNAYCAGQVAFANAPGLAFLESAALLGFLPGISEALTGESLTLPAADTWWCGEAAARQAVEARFSHQLIKSTYPRSQSREGFSTVLTPMLTPGEQQAWKDRIDQDPEAYTLQTQLPLDTMPVWRGTLLEQPYLLRVFALRTGPAADQWQVLPGGMARVVGAQQIASMQKGGSSADVWLIREDGPTANKAATEEASQQGQSAPPRPGRPTTTTSLAVPPIVHRGVTSRAAENLFWMGRYSERSENSLRLAQVRLDTLLGEIALAGPLEDWMARLWMRLGPHLPEGLPLLKGIIETLGVPGAVQSLAFNLVHLRAAASGVRDRLSHEHWQMVEDCCQGLQEALQPERGPSVVLALKTLEATSRSLASITGAQSDRMMRDDGWQLLMIGRLIERLSFLTDVLMSAAESAVLPRHDETVFQSSAVGLVLTRLFETTPSELTPLPAHTPRRRLMDLFICHDQSPRSLTWVALALRKRLSKLAQTPMGEPDALAQILDIPATTVLNQLSAYDPNLLTWLTTLRGDVCTLSEQISQQYFVHAHARDTSLGG
jgi:uncharacterized circularly permuted ATP-grasp superfamily protein/uncharacterized alpha-E superfamily protein